MNDEASRYQRQPSVAHVDGKPLGSERPAFEIPSHAPERPYVMPVDQVNRQLSKGNQDGTLQHSLSGITGTTKNLITHQDGQPRMCDHPTTDEKWMP